MLTTLHTTANEAANYNLWRAACRQAVTQVARRQGRRFAQIVSPKGEILDVLEIR